VLTCEHASYTIPAEYDDLGLAREQLREHIAWDIGARHVTEMLAREFDATAVLAGASRLVIDCNRDLADHDLIVAESHGVNVPGNTQIAAAERERRIREFYHPYHDAIDAVLARRRGAFLLSVHSFTPVLRGRERRFDVGVLFDAYAAEAHTLGEALTREGLRVRYNEPYSGLDGLIFSARQHGAAHGIRYLEIEINNALIRGEKEAAAMAGRVARALRAVL
jgi:predicted N-formylglutamate amidohydrolase